MIVTGLIHVHSTYSYDGKESLASLKQFLIKQGINFCCLTEHTDLMTEEKAAAMVAEAKALSDYNFIFIPGFEVPYLKAHILLIGAETFRGQKADSALLRTWAQESALAVLAHPVRNEFVVDEVMLAAIAGVEIWNQQYEGKIVPRPRSMKLLKDLKSKKPQLLATGGTDFHRREHFGAPVYSLEVDHLGAEAILEKLVKGDYYFGHERLKVGSTAKLQGDTDYLGFKSASSIFVISLGKSVNRALAVFGLKLPKSLKQLIRAKV